MDVYDAISGRFSVRSYQDKAVEEDKLHRVLDAGRIAPSAANKQAWKFIVVRDGKVRSSLAEAADQPFVGEAPVVIAAVSLDPAHKMHCGIEAGPVDCAIALDHMTLAAVAEGLGTCWIGHFDQGQCCKILNVPSGARIIELLPLGYPAATAPPKKRKGAEKVICHETFS